MIGAFFTQIRSGASHQMRCNTHIALQASRQKIKQNPLIRKTIRTFRKNHHYKIFRNLSGMLFKLKPQKLAFNKYSDTNFEKFEKTENLKFYAAPPAETKKA